MKWKTAFDYRWVNEKKNHQRIIYPIPITTDLLDQLVHSLYVTNLDLASGFHQVKMMQQDIRKNGIQCQKRTYEYLRMPFGMKNFLATFFG